MSGERVADDLNGSESVHIQQVEDDLVVQDDTPVNDLIGESSRSLDYSSAPSLRLDERTLYFLKLLIDRVESGDPKLYVVGEDGDDTRELARTRIRNRRYRPKVSASSSSSNPASSYLPVVVLNNDTGGGSRDEDRGRPKRKKKMDYNYYDEDDFYYRRPSNRRDFFYRFPPPQRNMNNGFNRRMGGPAMYGSFSGGAGAGAWAASPSQMQMQLAQMRQMAAASQQLAAANSRMRSTFADGAAFGWSGLTSLVSADLWVVLGALALAVAWLNAVITMAANGSGRRSGRSRGGFDVADDVLDLMQKGNISRASPLYSKVV